MSPESATSSGVEYPLANTTAFVVVELLVFGVAAALELCPVIALAPLNAVELPSLSVPGNHEYRPLFQEDIDEGAKKLSVQWNDQFTLPNNGVKDILETNYFIDYQGVRFISLDSNIAIEQQKSWLRKALRDNPNRWTILTFHHPLYSPASSRDNVAIREQWKPILDVFRVDLVLSGHDHSYSRTGFVDGFGRNSFVTLSTEEYNSVNKSELVSVFATMTLCHSPLLVFRKP